VATPGYILAVGSVAVGLFIRHLGFDWSKRHLG